jgi:hypothetical protein
MAQALQQKEPKDMTTDELFDQLDRLAVEFYRILGRRVP